MPQKSGQVSYHDIQPDEAGQRLDNFLLRQFKGVPRSHVYRLVRSGQVRVNGKRAKPFQKLKAADSVRLPPVRTPERDSEKKAPDELLNRLRASICYEDDRLIVVNKPSGLAVHGGSGQAYGLIESFRQLRNQEDEQASRLELVHRLDRETSGLLMLAKDRKTLLALHAALKERDVIIKRYVTLVQGEWKGPATVTAALKSQRAGGQHGMAVDEDGRASETSLRVVTKNTLGTLLEATLHTGRMHQIRVHCASAGHPVAADSRYGDRDYNRELRQKGLKRMFLHASALTIPAQVLGTEINLKSELPADLQQVLDNAEAAINQDTL